jgi:hypothetical protein
MVTFMFSFLRLIGVNEGYWFGKGFHGIKDESLVISVNQKHDHALMCPSRTPPFDSAALLG